jgi:hypothetical protein
MPKPAIRTFVSYSHEDRHLVEPIVTLLSITRKDVFWDYQSIPIGTLWRKEVETALNQAEMIAVFWCRHAERSSEVTKELKAAKALGKSLVPIMLDETKMPRALREYQAVAFRTIGSATHRSEREAEKAPARRLHAIAWPLGLLTALGATVDFVWESIGHLLRGEYNDLF